MSWAEYKAKNHPSDLPYREHPVQNFYTAVPKEMADLIRQAAAEDEVSMSKEIRLLLGYALEARGLAAKKPSSSWRKRRHQNDRPYTLEPDQAQEDR